MGLLLQASLDLLHHKLDSQDSVSVTYHSRQVVLRTPGHHIERDEAKVQWEVY